MFIFQEDNILKVELDLPNRTTRDYSGPSMPSSLQAALNAAFQEGDEIVFDATYVRVLLLSRNLSGSIAEGFQHSSYVEIKSSIM